MKTNDELLREMRIAIVEKACDGGIGMIKLRSGLTASVIWSNGGGWDHVSVAPFKQYKVPTWEDMCNVKDIFFHKDETVVQYHPSEENYVNNVKNCLHIWRPQNVDLPMPPKIMVGIRNGQTIENALEEAKALRGEIE